jgi:hypothetical protein
MFPSRCIVCTAMRDVSGSVHVIPEIEIPAVDEDPDFGTERRRLAGFRRLLDRSAMTPAFSHAGSASGPSRWMIA